VQQKHRDFVEKNAECHIYMCVIKMGEMLRSYSEGRPLGQDDVTLQGSHFTRVHNRSKVRCKCYTERNLFAYLHFPAVAHSPYSN
jgi:hypothetical protein